MNAADRVRPVKIGDGARHLQSAVVCAGRQSEGLGGLGEKRSARRVWRRETLKGLQIEDGVEASAARRLRFAGAGDASCGFSCAFDRRRQCEIGGGYRRHIELDIDAIEQRA